MDRATRVTKLGIEARCGQNSEVVLDTDHALHRRHSTGDVNTLGLGGDVPRENHDSLVVDVDLHVVEHREIHSAFDRTLNVPHQAHVCGPICSRKRLSHERPRESHYAAKVFLVSIIGSFRNDCGRRQRPSGQRLKRARRVPRSHADLARKSWDARVSAGVEVSPRKVTAP